MISFHDKFYSDNFVFGSQSKGSEGRVYVRGSFDAKANSRWIEQLAPTWQKQALEKKNKDVLHFVSEQGPVWIVARQKPKQTAGTSAVGDYTESDYAWYREQVGGLLGFFKAYGLGAVQFEWVGTNAQQELGALVGLNMAAYNYKSSLQDSKTQAQADLFAELPVVGHSKKWSAEFLREMRGRSRGINLARHLVNCPPNDLNPTTYADFVTRTFARQKGVKVEVWKTDRLKKESMGLLLGVGRGAENPPCLLHLQYRPGVKGQSIALVGKGITFDSGGLDIKPSSGMRLMKKDMGGSAAVVGVMAWAVESKLQRNLDVYLALAENAVDSNSMRPSDVLTSRNGLKVEIHNTDAEGRLVLADAMDVALESDPEFLIDVATLTGAIKVALGAEVAGLFSNDAKLCDDLYRAGLRTGDLSWKMPLVRKYASNFSSNYADLVNATDGFGGAITAALFLEKFAKDKPWAHLDIYAWADKASGAIGASGGSGQAVQCLADFLLNGKNKIVKEASSQRKSTAKKKMISTAKPKKPASTKSKKKA